MQMGPGFKVLFPAFLTCSVRGVQYMRGVQYVDVGVRNTPQCLQFTKRRQSLYLLDILGHVLIWPYACCSWIMCERNTLVFSFVRACIRTYVLSCIHSCIGTYILCRAFI